MILKGIPLWKIHTAIAVLMAAATLASFVAWLSGAMPGILVIVDLLLAFVFVGLAVISRPYRPKQAITPTAADKAAEKPLPHETKSSYVEHPDDPR